MRLQKLTISGYKALNNFQATLGSLEVFVGANGTGKTSLFEILRFLRDGMTQEIPPEIVPGALGQQVFHHPGPDQIIWELMLGEPKDSEALTRNLEDFGPQEIEVMHRSDELEQLA